MVKVPEKAVAFEQLSNDLMLVAILAFAMGLFMMLGASLFMSDLVDLTGDQITYEEMNALIDHSTLLLSSITVFIVIGIVLGGLAFLLKWRVNKDMGGVMGVADVEIALLEKKIEKELERNRKRRSQAQKQIETINEIEKAAEEKKLIEPGQTAQ
jgi:uncharacterized membrane protein (UPF0182 family)